MTPCCLLDNLIEWIENLFSTPTTLRENKESASSAPIQEHLYATKELDEWILPFLDPANWDKYLQAPYNARYIMRKTSNAKGDQSWTLEFYEFGEVEFIKKWPVGDIKPIDVCEEIQHHDDELLLTAPDQF